MPRDLTEEDIWSFYYPEKLYKPPFCDKDLSKVRRFLGEGEINMPHISNMKAQEDHGNPPPAPPPRGVTGPGAASLPPPQPASNTLQPRFNAGMAATTFQQQPSIPSSLSSRPGKGGKEQHPLPSRDGHLT